MNPVYPPSSLIMIFIPLAVGAAWFAWRSFLGCVTPARTAIAAFRFLGVVALSIPFFNPGSWKPLPEDAPAFHAVLVDRSASMTQETGGTRRWELATRALAGLRELGVNGEPLRFFTYSTGLEAEQDRRRLDDTVPDGKATDAFASIEMLAERFADANPRLGSILLVGDGRQTVSTDSRNALALCRAAGVPVFALPIGESVAAPDIALRAAKNNIVAFCGRELALGVRVASRNLPPAEVTVVLRRREGADLAKQIVRLGGPNGDAEARATFQIEPLGVGRHEFEINCAPSDGERDVANNTVRIAVQSLDRPIRALMVEGSPYWDTKFIAQLLQRDPDYAFEVVYRLSDKRLFALEKSAPGETTPASDITDRDTAGESVEGRPAFPATAEELAAFDLVILGRNIDPLIDSTGASLLRAWVERRGGALILARGNPLTTTRRAMEDLFPADWGESHNGPYDLAPTPAGEESGLFGADLPGAGDPFWTKLPPLQNAEFGLRPRTFAWTLAEGVSRSGVGAGTRFPLVVARRTGEGLVVSVNAIDLWRWGFFPQTREAEQVYRDFWFQLFQWTMAFSEFLPGKDFAMRTSHPKVMVGDPLRIRLSKRSGIPMSGDPALDVSAGDSSRKVVPRPVDGDEGIWEALFVPEVAGRHLVELKIPGAGSEAEVYATFEAVAPPSELDATDPDTATFVRLTEATGGKMLTTETLAEYPPPPKDSPATAEGGLEWKPAWSEWPWLIPLFGFFAAEWIIRRRSGLI